MEKKIASILLIDDNPDDNFFHERVIRKNNFASKVIVKQTGNDALDYLKENGGNPPDLIFLDINMPGMNGWEFLQEYQKLNEELRCKVVVVMLTSSDNPDDITKAAREKGCSDYKTKPLTREIVEEIFDKFF